VSDPAAELARLRDLLPCSMAEAALRCAPRLDEAEERLARGQPAERSLRECAALLSAGVEARERREALTLTITYPEHLPVAQRREEILDTLRASRVLVLTGETGSGKTTQLPKMLLELGLGRRGMIALTQPRRVAAVAMAGRIREELTCDEKLVAHAVRFDDRSGPDTLLKVMTDGLLLAEAASDPLFSRYDAVIVDEAHERSLDIDLLLGLLRLAREYRPDLRIIISSASIAAERFAVWLDNAPVIHVSGRTYPVEILHQPPGDDDVGYQDAAIRWVKDLHEGGDRDGDILVFLPTERDILEADRRLREVPGLAPMPLFGRLTPHEQQRIFLPAHGRKVVLATNIAETSLTIPGIRYVVDTGLARMKRFQPSTRTERLPIEPISRASALQRAGRAGRVEAGVCVRLYDEDDLARRDEFTAPEILRSNLAGVLLRCLGMGLGDPQQFPWMDPPASHAWDQARVLLDELGAMHDGAPGAPPELSALGRTIAAIPADPQVARILIAGLTEGVPHEACTIAAFLSVQDPRVRPLGEEAKADAAQRALAHEAGDIASVLRLWDRWEAAETNSKRERLCRELYLGRRRMREWSDVRHQLWGSLRERRKTNLADAHKPEQWPLERVHRAVLAGMLGNVLNWDAKLKAYRASGDRQLAVHPGSALRAGKGDDGKKSPPPMPWLVACEVVETSRLFARLCAPIDPQWVVELAGDRIRRSHREPRWDASRRQVVVTETLLWKGLAVREGRAVPFGPIDPAEATKVFIREALGGEDPIRVGLADANRTVFARARQLRDRLRDPALAIETEHLAAWYAARFGSDAVSTAAELDAWIAAHPPEALRLELADLVPAESAARAASMPDAVTVAGRRSALVYRYSPGSDDDGVTLALDEEQAAQLTLALLDGLVPGWLPDLCQAFLEQLPKDARRALIPLAESSAVLSAELAPFAGQADLALALADLLATRHGIRAARLDRRLLPVRLRPRVIVRGAGGVVWSGRDPEFLAAQAEAAPDRLALLKAEWETAPCTSWPGDCPTEVTRAGVRGHVALERSRAADGGIAVRRAVHAGPEAAAAWHRDGLEAALEAVLTPELTAWVEAPAPGGLSARCEKLLGLSLGAARRQLGCAAIWHAIDNLMRDEDGFAFLCDRARTTLATARGDGDAMLLRALDAADRVRTRLKQGARNLAAASAQRAAAADLARLTAQPWAIRLPFATLRRLDQLVAAIDRRLESAAKAAPESARTEDRILRLSGDCAEALDPSEGRWHLALGLAVEVRRLRGQLEECALAYATPGAGPAAARAEAELRLAADKVERAIAAARDRITGARARLAEARLLTGRIADAIRRQRTERELDELHRHLPDLTVGADLAAQERSADALVARVRAALG
jgi:ATP-dependent helicase HrpA